jgi:hypothetical protein
MIRGDGADFLELADRSGELGEDPPVFEEASTAITSPIKAQTHSTGYVSYLFACYVLGDIVVAPHFKNTIINRL